MRENLTRERQEGNVEKHKGGRKLNGKTDRNVGNVKCDGVRKEIRMEIYRR